MKWLRFAWLALLPASLAAACAAGVQSETNGDGGDDGSGGDPTGSTSSGTGGMLDAGPPPDAMIACDDAADCAWFNDTCNVGSCVNGLCTKLPANEYGSCDDGLFCTENDTCVAGACAGGTPRYCPSLDSCHLGICDEDLKTCKNVAGNDGAQCEDGDNCTGAGICNQGVCNKGSPISCDIFTTACSIGVCDPAVGCVAMPVSEGSWCDDGSFDPCSEGQCQSGMCVSLPINDGSWCDDGLFCTINDKCVAGSCSGDPNPCAPPENPCMIGTCNEFNWSCVAVPGNNGMACEDGNFCTGGEVCSNGQCIGGVPANEGMACDDANGCTGGTTCVNGTCENPQSEILMCSTGDSCCPAGCDLAQDADCLYWVPGVQQNVDPALLSGWSQCWSGTYTDGFPSLQNILAQCDKSKLLMACRPMGSPTYTLLAMGPRLDVLFDCGSQSNCTKQSNGVGWYYSSSYSWGFAPGGMPVNRSSCDYNDGSQQSPELRMCWHTGGGNINQGYRCGSNDLNGGFNWERVVYEAD
ncbi:MAG: hypothetical protein HUU21_19290 [Polyangiaceae bacterium]|nr:hypothetical protein [Polyangiaceae bacterium]